MPYDAVITHEEIKKLLGFLPYFQDSNSTFYRVINGYMAESEEVRKFREELNQTGFLMVFNWHEWLSDHEEFKDLDNDIHDKIMSSDLDTLRKLMTSYIRGDRFNEGLFISAILKGHIRDVLLRLQELKDSHE
ncbi:DUF6508 domain-containing protein [Paenibacillus puldeungensis]|uniref:DUF6508 domain-containing protein n=1 Tax=Paenibacillus puldeungensis TaxID=696536 RepID=A0ABW3RVS6_9BACL